MRKTLFAPVFGFGIAASLLAVPMTAMAKPDCTEAKGFLNVIKAFHQADADLTNIIQPELSIKLTAVGDNPQPSGIRYIYEAETHDFPLDETGKVLNLENAVNFNKEGKLCKLIDGHLVEETDAPTGQADLSFSFPFKQSSGEHSAEALYEGAKDGSKVMKALAPGGLGFVVPGLKSIVLKPRQDDGETPQISFWKEGAPIEGPKITKVGQAQFFKLKALKQSKADTIKLSGDYQLEAFFKYDEADLEDAEAKRLADLAAKAESADAATQNNQAIGE
ncbi:hypothetical protein DES40_1649 [Litorimonas taeanensis]|uniref:Outer membrane lipoprotein-sorting protein n=1 Tax=Litorimonas taeanensis TaxID=568099 RepID=A0A420WCW5_9PROT|nr:hypothetical protein [Litorimonas taeanensis]RKQ68874.1 hypothetical protein DES40_1649 [Litorimonas taeanensis]